MAKNRKISLASSNSDEYRQAHLAAIIVSGNGNMALDQATWRRFVISTCGIIALIALKSYHRMNRQTIRRRASNNIRHGWRAGMVIWRLIASAWRRRNRRRRIRQLAS